MTSKDIRDKFIRFFVGKGHKEIAPAKLVPENDPSTLFTSSGMQPLVPYLLGQLHSEGKRLVDSQPSFRAEDIEEVGDNRHTTFFEMLGNWSLNDYFKKEQLSWSWEFLTKKLGLDKEKLYVSVFGGNDSVPKDLESFEIWKSLGVTQDHIFFYGVEKNWWSRSGPPDKMPEGEIGGPDSEVFYDFGTPHDEKYGSNCHPNCDCGRFLEIGNSVFIQYQKTTGSLKEFSQRNVDFGGGLERLTAAVNNTSDIFETDLYKPIIDAIVQLIGKEYEADNKPAMQVIADHMKTATFLIKDGVVPSNKLQGYVLRRLLRRSATKFYQLTKNMKFLAEMIEVYNAILSIYDGLYGIEKRETSDINLLEENYKVIFDEMNRFGKTLSAGFHKIDRMEQIDGKEAFDLYQTFGFPYEVTEELFRLKGQEINKEQFRVEFEKHRELSRTASSGMFKGGLADHSETVIKYHTATHLLHQALRDILGPTVFQKGSNITHERLRFDFSYDKKMTDEEIKKTEKIVNEKIEEDLKVDHLIIPLSKAKELNAIGLFDEKYADQVSIYGIGPKYQLNPKAKDRRSRRGYYSLEFCGGPHVEHTAVIGKIKIVKEEAISWGIRRIRAILKS
ncbi:alanine--tRNA ligase [Candidatus Daviesbacteria bacterium]|nr:alanine--tRNA ligase [Candidatus Daviesbacteria bacterium]